MATVLFRGKAVIEGAPGTYDVLASASSATPFNNSVKATQQWEDEILKDNHGFDAAWLMRNEHETVDIALYIVTDTVAHLDTPMAAVSYSAGTAGAALSALGFPFLKAGAVLTLSGFQTGAAALNGVFRLLSGSDITLTNTGAAKYTLKLLKYADSGQQTAVATAPTGAL